MKKNISLHIHLFIYVSVMSGLLYSCRNNSPDDKAKGFPQSFSQNNSADKPSNGNNVNFVPAAKAVTFGVVHIKTLYKINSVSGNFPSSFGGINGPAMGSGSGVVLSSDGYVATRPAYLYCHNESIGGSFI